MGRTDFAKNVLSGGLEPAALGLDVAQAPRPPRANPVPRLSGRNIPNAALAGN